MIRYFYSFDYDTRNQREDSAFEHVCVPIEVKEEAEAAEAASASPTESSAEPGERPDSPSASSLIPAAEELDDPAISESASSSDHQELHHEIVLHAEVYVLAERYAVDGLKKLALEKFKNACRREWNARAFIAAARTAYDGTRESDVQLRESVVEAMYRNRIALLKDAGCKEKLQDMGHLMYDLVRRMLYETSPFGDY